MTEERCPRCGLLKKNCDLLKQVLPENVREHDNLPLLGS